MMWGSGVFPLWAPMTITALVGVLSILDLAAGTARRVSAYADLGRRLIRLKESFVGGDLGEDELAVATQKRLMIESSEPPRLRLLDALCHFEVLSDDGVKVQQPAVPWHRYIVLHFLSQPQYAQKVRQSYGLDIVHPGPRSFVPRSRSRGRSSPVKEMLAGNQRA